MALRGKNFELLNFPKFARPNVEAIQAVATAAELRARLGGGSFMSYGGMWSRITHAIRGLASDAFIELSFSYYRDEWKNRNLQEAFILLRNFFDGRGNWYPESTRPKYVLGFWFKPSIKGIWFVDGKAYAVAINARKHQPLSITDVRFLARGIYELHCIDDPNDPIPLIIDLSVSLEGERAIRVYPMPAEEALSLPAFESTVREFLAALNMIGLSLPPPPDIESVVDLFRR